MHGNEFKAKQTEKLTTLLRSIREVKTQEKPLLPTLERQADTENCNLLEQKAMSRTPPQEPVIELENLDYELLQAECGPICEIKTPGAPSSGGSPQCYKFYLQRLDQVLISEDWRKNPLSFLQGEGERDNFKACQGFIFLSPALKRNYFTSAKPHGFLPESNQPRGREIPNSSPLQSLLISPTT